MKFGLWDHVDRNELPLNELFEQRLKFVAASDDTEFYCFHIAEHHCTPLNLVPVPSVYLGAMAQVTRRIHIGPLVYLLPLYSPLCLIEEVSIIDQLCNGRFEYGVGRGISAFELNFHNVDPDEARDIFKEILDITLTGFTTERLNYEGKYYNYENVPMELKPFQEPHPAVWYPSSNIEGSAWGGEQGYNYVTLGTVEAAKPCIDAYKEAFAKRGSAQKPLPAFPGGTAIGVNRHMVIAETMEEAMRIARPAHDLWHQSISKLRRENVQGPVIVKDIRASFDDMVSSGATIVGTPDSVGEEVERQIEVLGLNYMMCGFYFGTVTLEEALRSLTLFNEEVLPKVSHMGLAAE